MSQNSNPGKNLSILINDLEIIAKENLIKDEDFIKENKISMMLENGEKIYF